MNARHDHENPPHGRCKVLIEMDVAGDPANVEDCVDALLENGYLQDQINDADLDNDDGVYSQMLVMSATSSVAKEPLFEHKTSAFTDAPSEMGRKLQLEAMLLLTGTLEIKPFEAGLASEARAVGKRLGEVLSALGCVDGGHIATGSMVDAIRAFRLRLHEQLTAAGWRVTAKTNGWKVLPPKQPRKK